MKKKKVSKPSYMYYNIPSDKEIAKREKIVNKEIDMFPLSLRLSMKYCVFRLKLSCWLWDLRGHTTCPYHGFHAQSWWTGYCKECGEKPVLPPMKEICDFCGEEKAVLQRADPNGNKEVVSVCWECNEFIDWSFQNSMHFLMESKGVDVSDIDNPDFDEWLFKNYQVWPKHSYSTIALKKKNK